MARKLLILIIALTFLIPNCSNLTDPEENDEKVIMPLSVGNEWIYEISYVSYNFHTGPDTMSFYTNNYPDTSEQKVLNKKIIETQIGFVEVYAVGTDYWSDLKFYSNTCIGLVQYRWDNQNEIYYASNLLAKYPADIGDTWQYDGNQACQCISTNEKLKTPAGTFKCYVYEVVDESASDNNHKRFYYAPNIGLIAYIWHSEIYISNDKEYEIPTECQDRYKKQLISYSLN